MSYNADPFCAVVVGGGALRICRPHDFFSVLGERSGIYITQTTAGGSDIKVDLEDAHILMERSWCHSPTSGAVVAWDVSQKHNTSSLHRRIMNPKTGDVVDHKNGDVTDNRRSNLRVCSQKRNAWNMAMQKNKSVQFKGVALTASGKFRAYIWLDGKQRHLGSFETPVEAAKKYDAAAREHFSEFCCVNFPRAGERSAFHDEVNNGRNCQ